MFQHDVEIRGRVEMLGNTVAAKNNRSPTGNRVPEKARAGVGFCVAGKRGDPLETGDLRDLRIGVQTGEAVLLIHERVKNGFMAKPARKLEILLIAGDCIEVRQDFIHAAVLSIEHLLHLLIRKTCDDAVTPVSQLEHHLAGLLIARDQPGVAQSGKSLVEVIPGHPFASEGFDVATRHLRPKCAAARDTANVTVAGSLLAALQFGNHVIEPATQLALPRIRSGGAHEGQRGEIMTGRVPVEASAFPIAVSGLMLRQAGFAEERRQQAVWIEVEQVNAVSRYPLRERTVQQTDGGQREQPRLGRGMIL